MKIAMLGLKGVPYPAGIENFTEQVGWRLVERGHQVTIYTRPYVSVDTRYRGMTIKKLPSINSKHLDALTHTFLSSINAALNKFDIAHFHALGPSVLAPITTIRGIKTIAHVHGLDYQRKKWGKPAQILLRGAEYASIYFPHRTLVVSRWLKNYFGQRYHKEVDYVPSGVNLGIYRKPKEILKLDLEKEKYLLFLARLVPEKGCHYLIRAFEQIETPFKLVIAGGSSHSDEYGRLLKKSKKKNIIFTGWVIGRLAEELFSNAYLYILPSEIEGLPHSLLQALSYGRCVVTSDIPPNLEALGNCGYTFKSKSPEDLKNRLEYLLGHPQLVAEEEKKAKERVRLNYSWDKVVDDIEHIYHECLNDQK